MTLSVVMNKKEGKCLVIDIARPFDTRISEKENEKLKKYQDLKSELRRIWKCNEATIVPVILFFSFFLSLFLKELCHEIQPN